MALAGLALIAAAPAKAEERADAPSEAASLAVSAAADAVRPLDGSQDEQARDGALTRGDPAFRALFASWSALDTAAADPFAAETVPTVSAPVSVPSRNPLNAGYLTSSYGMRVHPILGRRRSHKGIDLAAPTGTPVYATGDGAISRAERSRSYGLVIYIDHGADLETRYAHLSKLLVDDGQTVRKGDLIGYVGSTGRSTGPHLHYEVRVDGVAVNPIPYMQSAATRTALAEERDPAAAGSGRVRPGYPGGIQTGGIRTGGEALGLTGQGGD